MITTETGRGPETYSLGRTPEEYERLRTQARVWEAATGRLLDQVGLAPGATCLDAGCGPGETMRLMAHRVGPSGRVTGIDVDAELGAAAQAMLHDAGHRHCRVYPHDLTADESVPGAPYDLVFARLLLFHLPQRLKVLRRLWEAVAPGGHLVLQDYDLRTAGTMPTVDSAATATRMVTETFTAMGCDVQVGAVLPALMAEAGVGAPDGTDVAGRLEPFADGRRMLEGVYRSLLPVALARGITTEAEASATLAALDGDAARCAAVPMLWPLLIGAWKRKQG
jgi:trans-aconitate methyltransferase